ncbi:AvaI/BsoBI family type II restriction endonuclease [Neptunomonas phycophila]|uniref:AvaI/BsoBI family type II restriction endonuclease n=1 Tax=Neptunomonas phycophila TaxID=1572645 RepID=UPI000948AFCE|nr:AvaI/BsoBI family type II restriction endonuclease [Neptunomonas phycophila]
MNKYIKKSADLETTYQETKIGFLSIALRKSKEANHYLNLASAFRTIADDYDNPLDLINNDDITVSMCEAAGVSTKARGYLQPNDTKEILTDFVEEYLIAAGANYVDELISRYLLTQGDALGGRMRNIVGGLAGEKLTQNIISALTVRNFEFQYFEKHSQKWINGDKFQEDQSNLVKAIKWTNGEKSRLLYYDLTVPVVKKNIDIVLFNNSDVNNKNSKEFKEFISNHDNYLALGELKGGIDPAGADEHWKTANTALTRIRTAFGNLDKSVSTIFIGAAIEAAMAKEIYEQCQSEELSNCANLTKPRQLAEICDWLVKL